MKKVIFNITILFLLSTFNLRAQWSELGGLNGLTPDDKITTICTDASGNVYASGYFGNPNDRVAKFDGTSWNSLGAPPLYGIAYSLCTDATGKLYLGGHFVNGGIYSYVWRYSNGIWSKPGSYPYPFNERVISICADASGNVYAAGQFTNSSGNYYVAKYSVSNNNWSELGGPNALAANDWIYSVCEDASGNIYTSGEFTNSSGNYYVAKYNLSNNNWSELGGLNSLSANGPISSICTDNAGNVYVCGDFTNSSGNYYVAKYNGTTWSELGGLNALGTNASAFSVCTDTSGNVYTAGWFWNSFGKRYVAKYDGNTWNELGGLNALGANFQIAQVCTDAAGNVYAGGDFANSSGNRYVAKYSADTTAICKPPIQRLKTINITSTTAQLKWKKYPTAIGYRIRYRQPGLSWMYKTVTQNIGSKIITNLVPGKKYRWAIATICAAGDTSAYSVIKTFTTATIRQGVYNEESALPITEVSIRPNPAKDMVYVHFNSGNKQATIKLIDLTGKTVITKTVDATDDEFNCHVNVSSLIPGLYCLIIYTGDDVTTRKIIKE